ncbi:hypothetical protein BaRGS_00034551 [Batillaria attramentaria]|uniref:Uncharacterized protein n=1 Tax=Batillaria attramentaria TaxID=370345 RepID=A0ABD0JGW1_9CAEN
MWTTPCSLNCRGRHRRQCTKYQTSYVSDRSASSITPWKTDRDSRFPTGQLPQSMGRWAGDPDSIVMGVTARHEAYGNKGIPQGLRPSPHGIRAV